MTMDKLLTKTEEPVKVKVVLECGRNAKSGYSGDGCGSCETNTSNTNQAVCC